MRIAIIETLPRGGLLHYAVQLGEALAARGNEVDLITARENELSDACRAARMRAVLKPVVRPDERVLTGPLGSPIRRGRVAVRLSLAWARAVWEARRGAYDAVLIDATILSAPAAVGALFMTRAAGRATLAYVAHNARLLSAAPAPTQGAERGGLPPVAKVFLPRVYRRLDVVFVHGEATRADFQRAWPSTHVVIIPHGDERIFADEPPPTAEGEGILFFGTWNRPKGIDVLMAAFDELAPRRPAATLTLAGEPRPDIDLESVRRWSATHAGRVRLIDQYVPLEEVPDLFSHARVVVTPYLSGYQSGVVHLAMTMGRAVVSSDVGDLGRAVIDGETGMLVKPGDPAALAQALERVVGDRELAERMGAAGRERVLGGSSWERVAERVEDALRQSSQSP